MRVRTVNHLRQTGRIIAITIILSLWGCSPNEEENKEAKNYRFTGQLSNATAAVSALWRAGATTTCNVDNIMAVNPATAYPDRNLAELDDQGNFAINVTGGKPWILVFVDSSQVGQNMVCAMVKSDALDSLAPADTSGKTDLQTVTINSDGSATSSVTYADLIDSLGLSASTATVLGALDDVSLRYVNPDMDGDGIIDLKQDNHSFGLDFHIRFNMALNSTNAHIGDIVDNYLGGSGVADASYAGTGVTASYTSTGSYVSYPAAFSNVETGTFTYSPTVTGRDSLTIEGGTIITKDVASSAITANSFGDYKGFGPNTNSSSELPQGTLTYSFDSKNLIFTHVQTPALADLTNPLNRIAPFVRFVTASGKVVRIDYKWMQKTSTAWQLVDLATLQLLVNDSGGYISLRPNLDNATSSFGFTIPRNQVEGSIDWTGSNANLNGISAAELEALTASQLCHFGLSYDDTLGMRYFSGFDNAPGTCQ